MDDITFNEGPPPHIGWWLTWHGLVEYGKVQNTFWRWWDGREWSTWSTPSLPAEYAAARAKIKRIPVGVSPIRWSHYYPANARVPRLDGEWTYHHGGECPSDKPMTIVFEGGKQDRITRPLDLRWSHIGTYDVVAWRPL